MRLFQTCLLIAVSAIALLGQDLGRITGTVADATGAVIPGAKVSVKNEKTGTLRYAEANAEGIFFVTNLPAAPFTVAAGSPGFAPREFQKIELQQGQARTVDFLLAPAGQSQTITVTEGSLAEVDTSSARIGVNVSQREVGELPLNGRQISQLYLLTPGAQTAGGGSFDNIRFSGRSNQQNAVRFDGVEASSIVDASPGNLNGQTSSAFRLQASLETVQEFRVESSNYPAEYGTGTGGQIGIITKSGGNAFHGSVFEYMRNDKLDARNFFDGFNKSPLRLNQFGGSLGGPIVKDKLFFFGHYEGLRQRAGFPLLGQVPSAAVRNLPACPSGVTPGSPAVCVDAAIKPLFGAYPLGTIPTSNPDFDTAIAQGKAVVNENSGSARFDYHPTGKDFVYLRWFRDDGTSTAPFDVSGSAFVQKATAQNMVVNYQRVMTPSIINELKIGYNGPKTRTGGVAPVVPGVDLSAATINVGGPNVLVGIGGQGASSGVSIPSGLVRASSATNGRGQPYTNYSLSYVDSLSWIHGNHSTKFGGEFRQVRIYTDRLGGTTYAFSNMANFLSNTPTISVLGDLSSPSPFNNGATGNRLGKTEMFSAYAQDEYRLTRELTVSYGMRYEYYTPMREARNLVVLYNTVTGGLDAPGSRPFYQTGKTNFAPRLGLSWSPKGMGGKTVFRVGGGYNFGPGQGEDLIQPIESDRVSTSAVGRYPIDPAAVIANFNNNFAAATGIGVRAYAPGYRVPEKILSYTASLQHTLPGGAVVTVAYVGSQGRNLFLRSIANKVVRVNMNATTGVGSVVREFGSRFGEIDYKTSGGNDNYNSMQTTVNRRFSHGLTVAGQWTYGHSIGNTAGSNEAQTAFNPYDFNMDHGNNAFDVRHSGNATALWEVPFGKGRQFGGKSNKVIDGIAGGWQLGGVMNARTGLPMDIRITRPDVVYVNNTTGVITGSAVVTGGVVQTTPVINVPGGGNSRDVRVPDVVAGVNPFIQGADKRFILNPAAFTTPAPGKFGNLGRGALHGPGMSQIDLTLQKKFVISEGRDLQFRMETYNLFNRANFANPVSRLIPTLGTAAGQLQPGQAFSPATGGTFGQVQQTVESAVGLGAQRQIQLSLRFNF
jgi:hypothetical protein